MQNPVDLVVFLSHLPVRRIGWMSLRSSQPCNGARMLGTQFLLKGS